MHLTKEIDQPPTDADLRGTRGARAPPYFLQSLVFCNDFEELQTMLFEVELIINNAPLLTFTQILSKHV